MTFEKIQGVFRCSFEDAFVGLYDIIKKDTQISMSEDKVVRGLTKEISFPFILMKYMSLVLRTVSNIFIF